MWKSIFNIIIMILYVTIVVFVISCFFCFDLLLMGVTRIRDKVETIVKLTLQKIDDIYERLRQ